MLYAWAESRDQDESSPEPLPCRQGCGHHLADLVPPGPLLFLGSMVWRILTLYAAPFLGGRLQRVDCFRKALHSSACPHVLPHPSTPPLLTPYTSCSGLAVVLPHLPSCPWALLLAAPVHPHEHLGAVPAPRGPERCQAGVLSCSSVGTWPLAVHTLCTHALSEFS